MTMFVHAADLHLGITRYSRIDPETGLNLRGQDFIRAFNELCDYVVETRPDLFLICGDLFDRVNPTNYVRRAVQERFSELSDRAIDTIVIPGNHETPRSKGVSNPLILYRDMPHISIVLTPSVIERGPYTVKAVPFTGSPQPYLSPPDARGTRLLMMHASLEGASLGSERYMCFDEDAIKKTELPSYDYVAMGHIHKAQVLHRDAMPIVYPGSIERYDFNEVGEHKGFFVVDDEPEFVEVGTRPMLSRTLCVDGLTGYEITEHSNELIDAMDVADKIARIEFTGTMDEAERNSINFAEIKQHAGDAAYFTINDKTVVSDYLNVKGERIVFSPYAELERYLKMTDNYADAVYELGSRIIQERLER